MTRRSVLFLSAVGPFICFWASAAAAQVSVHPPPTHLGPVIEATTREPDAIRLHSLDLHVVIRGLHAETTATMIVSNSSPRDAEARVLFPLPPEAVVSGFSLKVGDRMVDGVVVERGQARVAFEGEMSKRVDPGIAEWTEDGSCRCRIFPVPPNGARTFAVTSLAPAAFEGDEAVFRLPLPVGTTLERLHISVEAADTGQDPRWTGFGGLVLTKEGTAYRGELNLLHVTPESGASIRIPRVPPRVVEVEQSQGEHYLFVSEAAPNRQLRGPGAPGKIAIGWDASGSRSSDSVERDLRFLKDLAATWKHTDVRVVVFRDRPEQPRRFSIRDGDAGELLSLLAGAPCDGGTDLGALDFSRLPGDTDTPDLWLLFTDGKATLDSGLPTLGDVPVIVVSSDRQRNSAVLRRIASVTGGAFLDLTSPVAGDGLTGLAPLRVDIQAPAGALSDIRHSYDPLSGRVTVVARLRADCKVSLVYWQFGKEVGRATIAARLSGGVPGSNLRLHWAAGRAEDLFVTSGKSTDELLELARSHGIVTGASSLIVLENIAQYLRYKITPPETWPELRAEYLEKRRQWPDGPAPPGETVVKPPRRPISFEEVRSWFSNSIEGAVSDLWKRTVHTPEGSGGSAAIHETAREGGGEQTIPARRSRRAAGASFPGRRASRESLPDLSRLSPLRHSPPERCIRRDTAAASSPCCLPCLACPARRSRGCRHRVGFTRRGTGRRQRDQFRERRATSSPRHREPAGQGGLCGVPGATTALPKIASLLFGERAASLCT